MPSSGSARSCLAPGLGLTAKYNESASTTAPVTEMLSHQNQECSNLSSQTMSRVLERARAIEAGERLVAPAGDLEAFLRAGEELGIGRDALLQALREEVGHSPTGFAHGDMVFAKSADGFYYIGTILDLSGPSATVRFAAGGEQTCSQMDLRAFQGLPGLKVQANFPVWGWATCEVIGYDADAAQVTVSDGFVRRSCGLQDIRMAPPKQKLDRTLTPLLWRVGLLAATGGAILGALLMALLT